MEIVISIVVATMAAVVMLVNFYKYKREAHDPYNISNEERELLETSFYWIIAPKVLSRDENALRETIREKMKCAPHPGDVDSSQEFLINELFPLVLKIDAVDGNESAFISVRKVWEMACNIEKGESVKLEENDYLPVKTHGSAMRRLIMYGLVDVNTQWDYLVWNRSSYGEIYLLQEERHGFVNWLRWVLRWVLRGD